MSKQRIVEIITDSGHNFGQISSPNDLILSQQFAHQHIEKITQDFLQQTDPLIAGCGYSLQPGTLHFNVAEGRVYFQGLQFDAAAVNLTHNAADSAHARLDYVVATISGDAPQGTTLVPFQRIRTSDELTAHTPPYPPTQFNRATEKNNIATVQIRTGTPSASPAAPTLQPTDTVLYVVTVPANATGLVAGNVADTRNPAPNLAAIKAQVAPMQGQINQALDYPTLVKDFGASFGRADTLYGILLEVANAINVQRYRYPTIVSVDAKCPAAAVNDEGTWAVDIPVGVVVQFGAKFVGIYAENFNNTVSHPRYETASGSFTVKPIFEGESLTPDDTGGGNVIRFDVPTSTKGLYLKLDGTLELRSTITPSNATECLLMKITPNGSSTPTIKRYINSRNSANHYSGTYNALDATTKQFDNDLALPTGVGYFDVFGVHASSNLRYQIPSPPSYNFDSIVTVPISTDGDSWHVVFYTLSGL